MKSFGDGWRTLILAINMKGSITTPSGSPYRISATTKQRRIRVYPGNGEPQIVLRTEAISYHGYY
jgi:hypothetical protein